MSQARGCHHIHVPCQHRHPPQSPVPAFAALVGSRRCSRFTGNRRNSVAPSFCERPCWGWGVGWAKRLPPENRRYRVAVSCNNTRLACPPEKRPQSLLLSRGVVVAESPAHAGVAIKYSSANSAAPLEEYRAPPSLADASLPSARQTYTRASPRGRAGASYPDVHHVFQRQ